MKCLQQLSVDDIVFLIEIFTLFDLVVVFSDWNQFNFYDFLKGKSLKLAALYVAR